MSRGFDPIFAFPTLFQQLAHSPPARRAGFPSPAARQDSPPETLAVPAASPFDSTVCDFHRSAAPEDVKCIKITHGGIESGAREKGDIVVGAEGPRRLP